MIAKCDGLVPYPVAEPLNSIATLMYLLSRRSQMASVSRSSRRKRGSYQS